MNDDQLFRLILLAGFVILLPIGIYHRLKSRTGEKLDRPRKVGSPESRPCRPGIILRTTFSWAFSPGYHIAGLQPELRRHHGS